MTRIYQLVLLQLLAILSCQIAYTQDRTSGLPFASRSEVIAKHGMIATSHPLATQIGLDILKKGGSAIDAAIAANAFLGFADPGMCGIGGDLFAIVWDAKTKKLYGLNASGRAPGSLTLKYLQQQEKLGKHYYTGALSVTTPGCVDGWIELHGRFGKLAFRDLLQPAIDYAKEGLPITQETADFFKTAEEEFQKSNNSTFKDLFFVKGKMPAKGHLFKNPRLAHSLELIRDKGRAGFYEGEIAATIAKHIKQRGGFLSEEDLKGHHSEWVQPVTTNYRGFDVWEMPPNSQGMATLQILNLLEGYDVSAMRYGSSNYIHHLIEAKKVAYEDLAHFYGDPSFNDLPLDTLLSKRYATKRRALIKPNSTSVFHPGLKVQSHTVYLTVADSEGNMISLIQSICSLFGSGEVPEGLGFALQDRGGDFVLTEGHINSFAPGKRPFHTIMPAFVTKDGQPFLSFGVMGGDMQPIGQVQVLNNLIDFKMNLQEAGDAPRVYHQGTTNYSGHVSNVGDTYLESYFGSPTRSGLVRRGHKLKSRSKIFGGFQGIMVKDSIYYGASDSRKDGQAAGY